MANAVLGESEVFTSLSHGSVHLVSQLLISLVLRKIEFCDYQLAFVAASSKQNPKLTIEASVTTRQTILAAEITMNVEFGKAVHTLKLLKAVEWNLGSAGDELQKLGLFFLVEAANSTPEPLDLWRSLLVVVVFGVVLPVINVDVGETGDEKFEFLFVEDLNKFGGDDLVEAC
jgi:hypothetical protein